MIGLLDTLPIIRAKLRAKKLLVLMTVCVPGALFALLLMVIVVVHTINKSAQDFTWSAVGGQYLVKLQPAVPASVMGYPAQYDNVSPELAAKLEWHQQQEVAKATQYAKNYGITLQDTSFEPLYIPKPYGNGPSAQSINQRSLGWQAYIRTVQVEWARTAPSRPSELSRLAKEYGILSTTTDQEATISYQTNSLLKGGKEDLSKAGTYYDESGSASNAGYFSMSVHNSLYSFIDQSYIQRFIMPENQKRQETKDAIPVVITYDEAQKLFGDTLQIGVKPEDANAQAAWVQMVQSRVNGETYTTCYRSPGDKLLLDRITKEETEEGLNKGNASYSPPKVQYALPTQPCGAPTIIADTRTAAEKKQEAAFEDYQKSIGRYQPQERQLLTFQVVGVMGLKPHSDGLSMDARSLASLIVGPSYDGGAFIPRQMYAALSVSAQHRNVLLSDESSKGSSDGAEIFVAQGITTVIAAFATPREARTFLESQTCMGGNPGSCAKPWMGSPYGVNYLLIEELSAKTQQLLVMIVAIILGISMLVIAITMTRLIIDSRRETAVFRALGARRADIVLIYMVYSAVIAGIIVAIAEVLGAIGLGVLNALYAPAITDSVRVAYGVFDPSVKFSFLNIPWQSLLGVAGVIVVVSFVALFPPLIRNVRRSPIQDMREE